MVNTWLIMPASFARLFSAPERPMFSEPAKSTKFNFPTLRSSSPSGVFSLICTVIEKRQWDRLRKCISGRIFRSSQRTNLEFSFSFVAAICFFKEPLWSMAKTSAVFLTRTSSSPWMTMEPLRDRSSKTRNFLKSSSAESKSLSSSLYSSRNYFKV